MSITQRFGSSDVAAECAKAILYGREVRQDFPEEVLEEARAFARARVTQEEIAHRMDLRGLPIFTIDSAETKDIDDAISLLKLNERRLRAGRPHCRRQPLCQAGLRAGQRGL